MTESSGSMPIQMNSLKNAYGHEIELVAEDGSLELFVIKAEFRLGDQVYAALQSEQMRAEDEVELFRVIGGDQEPQLETIDDDDEWEAASEAYDDMLFANDERP